VNPEPTPAEQLREAERRIFEHPGYKQYSALRAFELNITGVFAPNWRQLLRLLDAAATNEVLAMELVQNVREPVIRDRFHAEATRCLHNYLASTTSLVDHARRLMRDRRDAIAEEFGSKKATLLLHLEVPFMVDLRNFTLHRTLPFFAHSLAFTNVNTPQQAMKSEVELRVAQLLEWDGWSPAALNYLSRQGEAIILRPVVRMHGQLVSDLNTWLHNALSKAIEGTLHEVNKLVIARNAVLTGGDFDAADRMARGLE
jgi:hypothetical protein